MRSSNSDVPYLYSTKTPLAPHHLVGIFGPCKIQAYGEARGESGKSREIPEALGKSKSDSLRAKIASNPGVHPEVGRFREQWPKVAGREKKKKTCTCVG